MYDRQYTILVFIIIIYSSPVIIKADSSANPCIGLKSCAACSQNPQCSWCMQPGKEFFPRCDTAENHRTRQSSCSEKMLFSNKNELYITRNEPLSDNSDGKKTVPVQPQEIALQIRLNEVIEFNMGYKDVVDYPLELYYLMDGTFSMKDDKQVLESLGDTIGERLRNLTSKFRQGFGTFVDKVTMPYSSRVPAIFQNPCLTRNDTCIEPYGFKNHMSLTNNTHGFTSAVKAFRLSASSDFAEGGLDALMQVMVCENEIGWSKQARRLIIFATDGAFHYAGDGRLGGIVIPNDCKCHMDSGGEYYTHSLVYDYPSMAQINTKAKDHSINLIFAATSDIIQDYKTLKGEIEGSAVTELARNSSNIVELVEKQYKEIKSKVEVKDNFPSEFFKVKYYSKCQNSTVERETNICQRLEEGAVVQFRVEIELIKCPTRKEEWKQQYKIYAVGVPDSITLDVESLCDCPCENKENGKPNSELCNTKGTELCGLCDCNAGHFGEFCECNNSTATWTDESRACKQGTSTDTCSGRGNCVCSQCECTKKRYTGPYCECDNENCDLVNEQLCAGHGTCDCGRCICNPGWSGKGCGCSTEKATCFEPGSDDECNGQGTCRCGSCKCNPDFRGNYCQICRAESCQKCDELKQCVLCKVFGTGIWHSAECELNCYMHDVAVVDIVTAPPQPKSDEEEVEILCRKEDPTDECIIIFSYIQIGKGVYKIQAQKTKECPPQAPIYWIITIVSTLVVLVGLILLCVYSQYRKHLIRKEYRAFEKAKANVSFGQQSNPIYNNPIGIFENPTYAGAGNN